MGKPKPLDMLGVGPDGTRVATNLGLREHHSDPHRHSIRQNCLAHCALNDTVTSSATFKAPRSCEYGLTPNSDCRTVVSLDSRQLSSGSSVRTCTVCGRASP